MLQIMRRVVRRIICFGKCLIVLTSTRHDDPVDKNPRNPHSVWNGRFIQQAFDLSDDFATAVSDSLSNRQQFAQDGFFVHHQISERIGGSGAQQSDVNGKRLVKQPRFPE